MPNVTNGPYTKICLEGFCLLQKDFLMNCIKTALIPTLKINFAYFCVRFLNLHNSIFSFCFHIHSTLPKLNSARNNSYIFIKQELKVQFYMKISILYNLLFLVRIRLMIIYEYIS